MHSSPNAASNASASFSFPAAEWNRLDGIDRRILEELAWLIELARKRTGGACNAVWPSRLYLAGKVGVSVGTISRHLTKLAGLGAIDRIHRRKIRDRWVTNLYRVRRWAEWGVGRATAIFRSTAEAIKRQTYARGVAGKRSSHGLSSPCAPTRTPSTSERKGSARDGPMEERGALIRRQVAELLARLPVK